MDVFFDFEHLVVLLEPHADFDVEGFILIGLCGVVGVFDEFALPGGVGFDVDHFFNEFGVEVGEEVEAACEVDHGADVAVAVDEMEGRDACLLGDTKVVGAESAGDVYDARTVVGGHIVAGDYAECAFAGVDPGDELLVVQPHEVFALE